MTFKRIEDNRLPEVDSITSTEGQDGHIFYLAHPLGAKYRTDIPSYYLTSVAPDTPGNVSLEISRSRLGNIIFKALVSSGRSWTDHPLFNHDLELLFIAKQKWAIGHYIWTNSNNELVAYEDDKDDQHRLAITAPLRRDIRDVLVATWCLRIWHDTSESSKAKREYMESMTPPEELMSSRDMRSRNRMAALGSLAGLGV